MFARDGKYPTDNINKLLTNAVVVRARLEALVAVARIGAGQVLTRSVPAQRPRSVALVHVSAHIVPEHVAWHALATESIMQTPLMVCSLNDAATR